MKWNLPQDLKKIYGETQDSADRYERLSENFHQAYGKNQMEYFSAPGRTEIIGNHTDHNGGKVIAAAIDKDTIAAAYPDGTEILEIISEGYEQKMTVDLKHLEQVPHNQGTISLIAGMAEGIRSMGYKISGFQAYVSSEVISASGVSSSASFEMLICSIINHFFNEGKMSCMDYARIGQYAENHFWDKTSGLMDQMACAVGGMILLNFETGITCSQLSTDFSDFGYEMIIINTGKGHADLNREYSEIPEEMKKVASEMDVPKLSGSSLKYFLEKLPDIRENINNDRALLRAIHFFEENKRVELAENALRLGDGKKLLHLMRESGKSSWELLQNCYSIHSDWDQKISLSLALTELFLKDKTDGCCRVHGGGFAGVIQTIVMKQDRDEYLQYMEKYAGKENIFPMKIRQYGAVHLK